MLISLLTEVPVAGALGITDPSMLRFLQQSLNSLFITLKAKGSHSVYTVYKTGTEVTVIQSFIFSVTRVKFLIGQSLFMCALGICCLLSHHALGVTVAVVVLSA